MLSERVAAERLAEHVGKRAVVAGWVHAVRKVGAITFLVLRERTGTVQVVARTRELPEGAARSESVLAVSGLVVRQSGAPELYEVQAERVEVLSAAASPLPFPVALKEGVPPPELALALEHRALSLRVPETLAVFKVQATLLEAFGAGLRRRGFTEIKTPKIVSAGAEGGSDLFRVQYFEQEAWLAQSPQFYKQLLVGSGLERVFEVGPAYRAEKHNTTRHLNEFTSMDVEAGFVTRLEELLSLEEGLLVELVAAVAERNARELALLGVTVPSVERIPRWPLAEAKERLAAAGVAPTEGDLSPAEEEALSGLAERESGHRFVFVTHYPRSIRPMYALPSPVQPALTESFDLLANGVEVTTGGLRIHGAAALEESMRSRGLEPERYGFYLEAFRHGLPPHGGFAIGAERLTAALLSLPNVRQASLFPRDRTRVAP